MAGFQSLPGFREFYPEDFSRRQHIFNVWRTAARSCGFQEYDAPVLEPLELYTTKSGDEIEGQLFSFTDKGERPVSLRPEMTPTVCRMVGAKAGSLKRPIKWFSIGEFYRYERAQKGRLRAFNQFNADIFGEAGPEAEIELISLLIQCLTGFGLTKDDFFVRLSDRDLWFFYLEALGFSDVQSRALLSAIDKIEKMGDDAFKAYIEAHGPLDALQKNRITDFLKIRSLSDLEAALKAHQSEKLSGPPQRLASRARRSVRHQDFRNLLPSTSVSFVAWPTTPDLYSKPSIARATCVRWLAADATTIWSRNWGTLICPRWDSPSVTLPPDFYSNNADWRRHS